MVQSKLFLFVDAAYGNNPAKTMSMTGFTFNDYKVPYDTNQKLRIASRFTKAELITAVTAAKTAHFL